MYRKQCPICNNYFSTYNSKQICCSHKCSGLRQQKNNISNVQNGFLKCTQCEETKSLNDFYINRSTATGYKNQCKECCNSNFSKYYHGKANEKIKAQKKKYGKSEKGRKIKSEYNQKYKNRKNELEFIRAREDKAFRLNRKMRVSMNHSLKYNGSKNGFHWFDLVNYDVNDLIKHLEKQFQDGMSWDNYGEWHIDHKIPISVFNFSSPDHIDFKKCWALKNLQPMWASENISKHNKIEKHFQPCLKLAIQ